MQTADTTPRQCIPHTDSGYHIQTLDTTYRQWIPHTDSGYHIQTADTAYRQWIPHSDSGHHISPLPPVLGVAGLSTLTPSTSTRCS